MDISNAKLFGQIQVSGIGEPTNIEGTVQGIVRQFVIHLNQATPRKLSSGRKEITLMISDQPFTNTKAESEQARLNEVVSGIDFSNSIRGPLPSESFEEFYQFLASQINNDIAAMQVACDWFDRPQDPDLMNWLNDPKVTRFIRLNVSNEEFQNAMPLEYDTLKAYIISTYPKFVSNLTFRTA